MTVKICGSCKIEKSESEFYKKLNGKSSKCKACVKISNKEYRFKNNFEMCLYRRNYYLSHKEELISYGKEYRLDPLNKVEISKYKKEYLHLNRDKIKIDSNIRRKIRRKIDPFYRLRNLVSRSIARMLKLNSSSKKGGSIKSNIPYSIDELKIHLESLFEPWMNWNNQGKYNHKSWNDNDQTTWRWQLDHIIPQSDLPYSSMQDDNFKQCWALANLRPLSAKQNILDGSSKVRHEAKNE